MQKIKKYFVLSLVLGLVALAVYLVASFRSSTITNDFVMTDTSFVTKIFIGDKANNSVILSKKNNQWFVNDSIQAINDNINIILETMMQIEIKHPVSKSSYQNHARQMASTATKVEMYEYLPFFDFFGIKFWYRETLTRVFYVGGPTQDNMGTLMKMEDSDVIYVTYIPGFNGYLSERFSPKIADWKSHEVFKLTIPQIDFVRVEFPAKPEESYQISNVNDRSFKLFSLVPSLPVLNYDTLRLLELLSSFQKINYESYLDKMTSERIDSLKNSIPIVRITVKTKLGQKQSLTLYHRQNVDGLMDVNGIPFPFDVDRAYAFSSKEKMPVLMQFFVTDNISRSLPYLKGEVNNVKAQIWE